MMMFGGSPTRVAVPPMLDANASASRKGTGVIPSRSHTEQRDRGDSSTVVTLSSSAEATAVTSTSRTNRRAGRPRASFAERIARYSNTPVRRITPTTSIMPSSRKITSQSMPVSRE